MDSFVFSKVNAEIYRCHEKLVIRNKETYVSMNPYISEDPRETDIEKRFFVGIETEEMLMGDDGQFIPNKVQRMSKKTFVFHTEFLREVVNFEAGLMDRIAKRTTQEKTRGRFEFVYDPSITYIRIGNMNSRFRQYLDAFNYLSIDEDVIFSAELKTKHKLLENFKNELVAAFSQDEHAIEAALKKYQDFLPLIIPGTNGVATFQFIIEVNGFPINRPDIRFDNVNEFPNVIELKREDTHLFKRTLYRNNTCELSDEFSNAIQQTNMQRNMISAEETNPEKVFVKSFLLIGNMNKEVQHHTLDENLLRRNFNVVKYNNKDCDIITYDQIIERIDLLLART